MAKIKSFKGVRPPRDKAYLVASRPYYTYKKRILDAKLYSNRFSFLHVINPEFGKAKHTAPNSVERFQNVREKYEEFIGFEYFIRDQKESLYIYRQQFDGYDFLGVIAGASVQEYLDGKIKIHEHTLTSREQTFKRYLDICKFNAEPVLLTYKDTPELTALLETYTLQRPEYEFTTTENKKNELWLVSDESHVELITKYFEKVKDVYIADGHHRTASAVLYAQDAGIGNEENQDYFLAFFIAESRLKIYDYNRVVTELNGLTTEEFIDAVSNSFNITPLIKAKKPAKANDITMLIAGKAYTISPKIELIDKTHPVKSLDVQILSDLILDPILGIKDSKTDSRVQFVEGTKKMKGLLKKMKKLNGKVSFALYPVSIEQLKRVADTNNIMPPKSTWVEPKMRSGLVIYEY